MFSDFCGHCYLLFAQATRYYTYSCLHRLIFIWFSCYSSVVTAHTDKRKVPSLDTSLPVSTDDGRLKQENTIPSVKSSKQAGLEEKNVKPPVELPKEAGCGVRTRSSSSRGQASALAQNQESGFGRDRDKNDWVSGLGTNGRRGKDMAS